MSPERSEREKMLAGDRYDPTDPELVAARDRARRLVREYDGTTVDDRERRQELIDELFGSTGDDS